MRSQPAVANAIRRNAINPAHEHVSQCIARCGSLDAEASLLRADLALSFLFMRVIIAGERVEEADIERFVSLMPKQASA